jgi:type VII secretion integral membrane protein EccD
LAGLVAGSTVLASLGALAAAVPVDEHGKAFHGGVQWPGTVLAIVVAIILMFRGRTYANAEESVALFAGGVFTAAALLVGAGVGVSWAWAVFVGAVLLAVAALTVGVFAPRQQATPPMRRFVELVELAFIASVLPLVCWVANLYSTVRGL